VHTAALTADLEAEHDALDRIVARLEPDGWSTPTPSAGWDVADQIGHLAYFDRAAVDAITEPDRFAHDRDELFAAALADPAALDELTLSTARAMSPADLLAHWRSGRSELIAAAATLEEGVRVPWYGPPMSGRSFLTARLMETWAHGQDVVDAVGARRPPTARLVHVAHLGVTTRGWSYANRGLDAPGTEVFVELALPDGGTRAWGDPAAEQWVRGPIEDFCLVVTQRRHVDDTSIDTSGSDVRRWMELAQAFAGGATDGPASRATD
jgi:uncharacterized protein (TIGR03084 family)